MSNLFRVSVLEKTQHTLTPTHTYHKKKKKEKLLKQEFAYMLLKNSLKASQRCSQGDDRTEADYGLYKKLTSWGEHYLCVTKRLSFLCECFRKKNGFLYINP